MPRPDIGEDLPASPAPPAVPAAVRVVWQAEGQRRVLHLLPFAVAEAGRHSSRPLCLRLEPIDDPANLDRSRNISSHHLTIRYLGEAVELVDPGSVNGTFVGGQRLNSGQIRRVEPGLVVSVAEVLDLEFLPVPRKDSPEDRDGLLQKAAAHREDAAWLQEQLIGRERPGRIDFVRIRRKNNRTEEEYALLYHAGLIGGTADALIRLAPATERTPRRRAIDTGDTVTGDGVRLFLKAARLLLEWLGGEPATLDGRPLEIGRPVPVPVPGELTVGATPLRFEA